MVGFADKFRTTVGLTSKRSRVNCIFGHHLKVIKQMGKGFFIAMSVATSDFNHFFLLFLADFCRVSWVLRCLIPTQAIISLPKRRPLATELQHIFPLITGKTYWYLCRKPESDNHPQHNRLNKYPHIVVVVVPIPLGLPPWFLPKPTPHSTIVVRNVRWFPVRSWFTNCRYIHPTVTGFTVRSLEVYPLKFGAYIDLNYIVGPI